MQGSYSIAFLIALEHAKGVVFSRTADKDARLILNGVAGKAWSFPLPVMDCESWKDDIRASKSLVHNACMEAPVIDLCVLTTINLAFDKVQANQAIVLPLAQLSDFEDSFAKLYPDGDLKTGKYMQDDVSFHKQARLLASEAVKLLVAAMARTLRVAPMHKLKASQAMKLEKVVMLVSRKSKSKQNGSLLFSVWIASCEESNKVRVLDHASTLHRPDLVRDEALKMVVRVFRYMLSSEAVMAGMITAICGDTSGKPEKVWRLCVQNCFTLECAAKSAVKCRKPSAKCEQLNANNSHKTGICAIFDATAAAVGSKRLAHTSFIDSPMATAFFARVVAVNSMVDLGNLSVEQLRTEEPDEIRKEIFEALQLTSENTATSDLDETQCDASGDEMQEDGRASSVDEQPEARPAKRRDDQTGAATTPKKRNKQSAETREDKRKKRKKVGRQDV